MKKLLFCSLGLVVLLGSVSLGTVRNVPAQYRSIQQAIDDSNDGDTVIVSPGVYYETINFGGRDIVVTSTDPNNPKVVGYTIINADGDGTVVTFENGESSRAVLTGFTITGGVGTLQDGSSETYKWMYGGGILCTWGSPTITRNVITNNHGPYVDELVGDTWRSVYSYGGGIYYSGGGLISHNIIYNNSAYEGGGIYGNAQVVNNIIYGNSAGYGGGAYVYYGSLENNTIVGNDCSMNPEYGYGGNVCVSLDNQGLMTVRNNIVSDAVSGGGLFYTGRLQKDMIRFNDVWNNAPANYGLEDPRTYDRIYGEGPDLTGRFGNISVDPLFLDAWNHNFRVQATSPCVSAGDPNFTAAPNAKDIDRDPRIFALRVDIGADEHVGYVKPLAHAGRDQHLLTPGAVTLDGRSSYFSDPCGVTTWQWSQKGGPAVELSGATTAQPTFAPTAEGWYTFALVVGDGQYTSGPDAVLVVVGNQRPVANAGPDSLFPMPGRVQLNGSKSHDADPPDELHYTWTQLEGPSVFLQEPNSPAPYFDCNEAGIYVFQLVVHDGFVASEPDTIRLETSRFTLDVRDFMVTDYGQGYYFYPDGAGSTIVYTGSREYDEMSWAIQCLDTETGRVDTFEGTAIDTMPKTDGNHVVWSGSGGSNYGPICTSLFLGDLVTGGLQYLRMESATESYSYPAISGNRVVWAYYPHVGTDDPAQYESSVYNICGADITDPGSPVFFTIAEKAGRRAPYPYSADYTNDHEDALDICGNLVVWENNGDIYGADISNLNRIRVFPICTAPERQYDPSISGHIVVWTDERNDIGDIYGADISDPNHIREFEVMAGPGWQLQPDVDGAIIAYLDGDDYYGNIEACCLTREYGVVHFPLVAVAEGGYYQTLYGSGPRVDGSALIWQQGQRIRRASLDFAYSVTAGPVQNLTTGRFYDYIQHAVVQAARAGDVVVAQPGTYNEKLCFKGKDVVVRSTDPQDPAVRAATVLAGTGSCVTFMDEETADCSLDGFTIAGGSFGVVCSGAAPTISNCTIVNQTAAGVKVWNKGNPTFSRCEMAGNGQGVEMWAKRDKRVVLQNAGTFRNCLIVGNRGAGFYGGYPVLENCTVADNAGEGIDVYSAAITNSIIYFNRAGATNVRIENAKSPVTYSDVQGGRAGVGNMDADPLFVARGLWSGPVRSAASAWVGGNYHLKSEGWTWDTQGQNWTWFDATSPCIDAGDPAAPLGDEEPCASGSPLSERSGPNVRLNMGAYGGTAEASLAPRGQPSAGDTP